MKKIYLKPVLTEIVLASQPLMSASEHVEVDPDKYIKPEEADARENRRRSIWDDDENEME